MSEKDFVNKYLDEFSSILKPNDELTNKIISVKNILLDAKIVNKKIMIFGNGGSAAIASHVSVDLTKNAKVRCVNYNEADLITCFSNDYGYENWVSKALNFYADKNDLFVCISSSGKSKNILNGAKKAKKMGCRVVTFSGFKKNNPLKKICHLNYMSGQTWDGLLRFQKKKEIQQENK